MLEYRLLPDPYKIGYGMWKLLIDKIMSKENSRHSKVRTALAKRGIGQRRSSRKFVTIEAPQLFDLTDEKKDVLTILENTDTNVFLTGKAGTGKSNFLKYYRSITTKNIVVLAFTGVAAVNVQGQTIHSFFRFHPQTTLDSIRRIYGNGAKVYKQLDTIIIDEISMVRADLLDCIDKFMRLNGRDSKKPFGGVQVFAIGDLFQLPPIVKNDESEYFKSVYKSPYFFDSKVYNEADFEIKKLTEVYRQNGVTQKGFLKTLNNLRECKFNEDDIALINTKFNPDYERLEDENIVSLVPTNALANRINMKELSCLSSRIFMYEGDVDGDFKESILPTELKLRLKEGAQVMLVNNDSQQRWINGDIVRVVKTAPEYVRVMFEDGSFDDVIMNKWDSIKFTFDEKTGKIQPEVKGSFTQLPLKLAWAVTIHKGQGKTFDKVHIDFGNGTFTPGQAYVALSRCRTLDGIVLTSPLEEHHVFTDKRIIEFFIKH